MNRDAMRSRGGMRVIYIAGRFSAPTAWAREQNIQAAERAGMVVVELGASPLIPHANTRNFHGTATEDYWYAATMELLRRSDAVLMVEGWEKSKGATAEKAEAERLGLPVFDSRSALARWLEVSTGADAPNGAEADKTAAVTVAEVDGSVTLSPAAVDPLPSPGEMRGEAPFSCQKKRIYDLISGRVDVECGAPAYGNQLEKYRLAMEWVGGPCCPAHGGPDAPKDGDR